MLVLLKHKQKNIASVMLSVFMGSWLLILCQTCLADVESNKLDTEAETCHTVASEDANVEHCLGVCDCDAIAITMNSEKSSEVKEKINFSTDVLTLVSLKFTLSTRAPPAYRMPPPERAILLPLQNYTTLLI